MDLKPVFHTYLQDLSDITNQGDAREESYYPALKSMLETFGETTGKTNIHVTTLPLPTEGGNPDFRIWNGTDRVIGYIEAKKPTEERLDLVEDTEQLNRYRSTFPNLILTNFLEFRLYRNGELVDTVLAGRPVILNKLGSPPPLEKQPELHDLLDHFLGFALPKTFSAETLAVELAKRTRILREVVGEQFELEKKAPGSLTGFYEAFRSFLIGSLTPEEYADLFAQTITYGLFAARTRAEEDFNRKVAFDNIPTTIGVLRDLFRFISLEDLPDSLAWCVEDLAEVLAVADAPGILDRYYHEGKGSDPIVHFYETFLAKYDPDERERRGVYYTPEPVVGYIVRSLHGLLKNEFDKSDGLAAENVTLLDPAAGTMTFVARAAQLAVEEFVTKYGSGGRAEFIQKHILKNFCALELMMAPYAVGHLKMGFFLEELGHQLTANERVRFYLTNTLDIEVLEQSNFPGLSSLAEESRLATSVKKEVPILLIFGNPPYSGHSSNKGDWISQLIDSYKQVDGEPLGEKNTKWLQDDYVKFLRFAQWKIEKAGRGVVGMITNHSYLDNPTFRGMRQSLLSSFDEIHILNLHGNSLKKETAPDGSLDQNVFDIRQGVAIAFFIKREYSSGMDARVYTADLFGTRKQKYKWLDAHDFESTDWQGLNPVSPFYLFKPRDEALVAVYQQFVPIQKIFPINSVGLFTARDRLTIRRSEQEMWNVVLQFSNMDQELARDTYQLGKDVRDWTVAMAQKDLLDSGPIREKVVPILYRPFDVRYTYYTGRSRGFICMPRPKVMHQMLSGENMALCVGRQGHVVGDDEWNLVYCSKNIEDLNLFYRGGALNLPLFRYIEGSDGTLLPLMGQAERLHNLDPNLLSTLSQAHGHPAAPEAVFFYIYAILHIPSYRKKYSEFLNVDYPRIPFTSDWKQFCDFASFGERLVALHLLKSPELNPPLCQFEGEGDQTVAKTKALGFRYERDEQRMYVNNTQYFGRIPMHVYEYRIGGYQICEKWLKDRKGRRLELEDIQTYCRAVTALDKTVKIQQNLDDVYKDLEDNCVTFETG